MKEYVKTAEIIGKTTVLPIASKDDPQQDKFA